ncbi:MAG: hypothetical protein L3J84_10400 [Gammaproteobacteria bacterium]|nr:hypothetical protein [Gammaproteobacteria bacterium]
MIKHLLLMEKLPSGVAEIWLINILIIIRIQEYNFRDRDILVLGNIVEKMVWSFDQFWRSELSVEVNDSFASSWKQWQVFFWQFMPINPLL